MQNLVLRESPVQRPSLQSPAIKERTSVLIVDDEEAIGMLLERYLARSGYDVVFSTDTERALVLLNTRSFDVLLCDLHMPLMNGDQLMRAAKSVHPDLVAVMITGATDARLAVQCLKNGAYDYITKPFDLEDVAQRIAGGLEYSRLQRENREYREHLESRVSEQGKRLKDILLESLSALTQALEAKDESTREHSDRVTRIAIAIAATMQPHNEELGRVLTLGANLHDIGKIGIPGHILLKDGPLTPDEMAVIKHHPLIGVKILASLLHEENGILEIVRSHHERWDGSGYPDGLKGRDIPLAARIVSVADSYDAMISSRPYRKALPHDVALETIRSGSGTQWDPSVVNAFLAVIEGNALPVQEAIWQARPQLQKLAA